MWIRTALAIIVLIGVVLIAFLSLRIGGALPGFILLFYVPFVFVGAAVVRSASLGFKRKRQTLN